MSRELTAEPIWQDAILVKHKDGNFGIYPDKETALAKASHKLSNPIEYSPIRFNYNRGQPLIDIQGRIVSIVDVDYTKPS